LNVDLKQLAARESEQVEWKQNVSDPEDVVRAVVAFANDYSNLGGGYVVCGARETKDEYGFQKVELEGMTASRCREVEGRVLTWCRERVDPAVVPVVDEQPGASPDKRVLVFIVPAAPRAHSYRDQSGSSRYYVRIGRETREARNGVLRELLVKKGDAEPWDRRVNDKGASLADIDLLTLRDTLQEMRTWEPERPLEEYLSSEYRLSALIPPLTGRSSLSEESRPRNFALLLFGKEPTRFIPGAYSLLSVYPGRDRSEPTAERKEIVGNLVVQARKLTGLLETEAFTAFDKTSPTPNQVKYPLRALQEAVVNALVHRDFESDQPVRVTVFSDRIEINSPGSLPRAVDAGSFRAGRASPFWRNQTLAYFFNKLQLAQAEGQGIPTILRTMKAEGCPAPTFDLQTESLICVLPAHPRHELVRRLSDIENRIILGHYEDAMALLEPLLEEDPYHYRTLEAFCDVANLLGVPRRVFEFANVKALDPRRINPSTVILMGQMFLKLEPDPDAVALARDWLATASRERLEGEELKRLVIGIRRLGSNEEAIRLVDDFMGRSPESRIRSSLLDIRARAKMDLAKKCMDTARSPKTSAQLRRKAWDRCRRYLDEAESDLFAALSSVVAPPDREYMEKSLDFLKSMKELARRPEGSIGRRNRK